MKRLCKTSNRDKDIRKILFLVVWLTANFMLFWYKFLFYYRGDQFYYLTQMLGYGLCMSRASASCINLNSALLLLPMCRRLSGYLLKIFHMPERCQAMSLYRWIHTYCAYMLCLMAVVHCVAHGFNAFNFCEHFDPILMEINLAKVPNQKAWLVVLKSWPGVSGVLLMLTLITITFFALKPIRSANYDRFLKTHHLFAIFYILLVLHSLDGVIKYQTNVDNHKPDCFVTWSSHSMTSSNMSMMTSSNMTMMTSSNGSASGWINKKAKMSGMGGGWGGMKKKMTTMMMKVNTSECLKQEHPKFASCKQHTWMWLFVPMFFYLIERFHRVICADRRAIIVADVTMHGDDVMQLRMRTGREMRVKPGQSVGIRCHKVSHVEMHPFTVTSSYQGEDGYYYCEVFIKCCGDWTTELKKLFVGVDDDEERRKVGERLTAHKPLLPENNRQRNNYADHEEGYFHIEMIRNSSSHEPCNKFVEKRYSKVENALLSNSQQHCFESCQYHQRPRVHLITVDHNFPSLTVEGPFSSCLQSVLRYRASICVAGGIGITPFASYINHLLSLPKHRVKDLKLKRLELVWVCRKAHNLLWFADVIKKLRRKLWTEEVPDLFAVTFHVTRKTDVELGIEFDWSQLDGIRVVRKRPDIKAKFHEFSRTHPKCTVGVFCCGPKTLVSTVEKTCSSYFPNQTVFKYHKESFS